MTVQANPIQPAPSTSFWSRWLLPSAADLVFLGLLFSLSCGVLASRLLGDAGIGWHIRNGQLMLQTHAITRVDPFSSTMSGQPWYAWEWLYDLLIAGVHHWAGLNGVVFLTALVVAATFALTLRLAVARGGDLPLTIVLLALAIGGHSIQAQQQVSGALASKAPEAAASSATAQANGHNSGTGSPGGSITLQ